MAACCGVPPYTPDQLMEIVVTDTTVSTRVGTALARPRRLSPSEGFALATSARALLSVSGSDESGALSRALAKLEASSRQIPMNVPPAVAPLFIVNPLTGRRMAFKNLFSDHPPTEDRIRRLPEGAPRPDLQVGASAPPSGCREHAH